MPSPAFTPPPVPAGVAMISAHRGGCGRNPALENTWEAFQAAATMPCEYVEFDVHRTRDGEYVLLHDDHVVIDGVRRRVAHTDVADLDGALGARVRYRDILVFLGEHGRKAHIDFKFTSPVGLYRDAAATHEAQAAQIAADILPPEDFILTTTEDRSVRALRDWADQHGYGDRLLVGLTLGRRLHGMGPLAALRARLSEMFPARRVRASGANLIVAQRHLARARLIGWADRHRLPILVWTVDRQREMSRLIADPRVWLVTSNEPMTAVSVRWVRLGDRLAARPAAPTRLRRPTPAAAHAAPVPGQAAA